AVAEENTLDVSGSTFVHEAPSKGIVIADTRKEEDSELPTFRAVETEHAATLPFNSFTRTAPAAEPEPELEELARRLLEKHSASAAPRDLLLRGQ
ncbi:unnamed protein product, partial [Polarella glacialis]